MDGINGNSISILLEDSSFNLKSDANFTFETLRHMPEKPSPYTKSDESDNSLLAYAEKTNVNAILIF